MKPDFKKILVVRSDRVGDLILTTPVFQALREAYPEARIVALIAAGNEELLEGNPYLDHVLVDDKKVAHRGIKGFKKLLRSIKDECFDVAFILHTKNRTNLLCSTAGIPRRVGYRNDKLGFLLTDPVLDDRPQGNKHEAEYCLDVLRAVGVPVRAPGLHVMVQPRQADWVQDLLVQKGISESDRLVAIHPGASCISKRWMPEGFARVASELAQRPGVKIVVVGGKENTPIVQAMAKHLSYPFLDATGQTSLGQLAAILARCRVLISNDSGPVHLAAGLKIPVVAIFGRNQAGLSPTRWGPWGTPNRILHKEVGCDVCLAHRCQIQFKCLTEISPAEVVAAVDALGAV